MQPAYRRYLTYALLASYGAIGLLGQGLHWLSLDERHQHGLEVVQCTDPGHSHAHHHHCGHHHHGPAPVDEADREKPLQITPSDCVAHSHDCDICAFLLQVRSERPQIVTAIIWQHVLAVVPAALQRSYSPISLGPHAPRGPPRVFA